jgi:hypothetical protein
LPIVAGESYTQRSSRPCGCRGRWDRTPGIFISYRRGDAPAYAGRLYDQLAERFGDENVFMDVDTIEPGADFVARIEDAVGSAAALLVVMGRGWVDAKDELGRRRLDDPEDFVRLEVASALQRNVRVIPVLVGGATMPESEQLPAVLASLSRRNALLVSDLDWARGWRGYWPCSSRTSARPDRLGLRVRSLLHAFRPSRSRSGSPAPRSSSSGRCSRRTRSRIPTSGRPIA